MIKVSVMYPNTPGSRFDHAYYRDKHMPLLKARMGDACNRGERGHEDETYNAHRKTPDRQ